MPRRMVRRQARRTLHFLSHLTPRIPAVLGTLLKIPSRGGSCEKIAKRKVWEGERPREPLWVRVPDNRLEGTLALPIFSELRGSVGER